MSCLGRYRGYIGQCYYKVQLLVLRDFGIFSLETHVAGDLLGISVPDLYRYVKELPSSTPIPNTKGSYTGWKDKVRPLKNGVFVIYR